MTTVLRCQLIYVMFSRVVLRHKEKMKESFAILRVSLEIAIKRRREYC